MLDQHHVKSVKQYQNSGMNIVNNKTSYKVSEEYRDKDSIYYNATCDCGHKDCMMLLELEKEDNLIFLNIYKKLAFDVHWNVHGKFNFLIQLCKRIKYACIILFKGRIDLHESFIIRDERQIKGLINALEEGCNYLKEPPKCTCKYGSCDVNENECPIDKGLIP